MDPTLGQWHLRDTAGNVTSFFFGNPGDSPMVGDWDCDGDDTPGLYRQSDGFVYLRNRNTQGNADIRFFFGNPGDIPLAGDFNGDGCDTVSIYRPNEARVFIINKLGADEGGLGKAEFDYVFGNVGDKPFVGDFDGDGIDTIGLHRESTGFVYFRQTHTQGNADAEFFFGDPGDRLVAGDWIGDGTDTPGLFRPWNVTFFLRYTNTQGNADESFPMGAPLWLPVAGNFGLDTPPPPTTTTTMAADVPPNPGDNVDCGDFLSQPEAQAWHDFYFPHYGDVANLDADDDGTPCEGLPTDEIALRQQIGAGDSDHFTANSPWRVWAFRYDTEAFTEDCAFSVEEYPSGDIAEIADIESGGFVQMRQSGDFYLSNIFDGCLVLALTNGASHTTVLPVTVRETDSLPFDAVAPWTVTAVRETGSSSCAVSVHLDADGSIEEVASLASGNSLTVTSSGRFYLSSISDGCRYTAAE